MMSSTDPAHAMKGPPGHHCTCGASFDDYYGLTKHIRLTIDCPRCGTAPAADLDDGELFRWQCGHWIARGDTSAAIRAGEKGSAPC
jgi:ribosomal protein S27AE